MTVETTENDTAALIDTALAAAEPTALITPATDSTQDGLYAFVLPRSGDHGEDTVKVIDTRDYRRPAQPDSTAGTTQHLTTASLTDYIDRHKIPDQTTIFGDPRTLKVVAVINDHEPASTDSPQWGDHRAVLTYQRTPAWKRWLENDRKWLQQVDFAEHIEDGLLEVIDPDGATLLELAQSFKASRNVDFGSASRLQSGDTELKYTEQTTASAGQRGDITIPPSFRLRVTPFDGADPAEITARLRYRIDGGRLLLGYLLDRPEEFEATAFATELGVINIATKLIPFIGTPRA